MAGIVPGRASVRDDLRKLSDALHSPTPGRASPHVPSDHPLQMDGRSGHAGNYGFGTWRPESSNTEETSGGVATFHTPVQETPAAGPSARVRPMVKGGGGGKAGDHGVDKGEGTERATLSTCAKKERPWMRSATTDSGHGGPNHRRGETSGGVATFHTPVQETPAAGPSAHVRPREKSGGGGKAGKPRRRDLARCQGRLVGRGGLRRG